MMNDQANISPMVRPLRVIISEAIDQAIVACGGNIPRAAKALGVAPSTLYRKRVAGQDQATEIPE